MTINVSLKRESLLKCHGISKSENSLFLVNIMHFYLVLNGILSYACAKFLWKSMHSSLFESCFFLAFKTAGMWKVDMTVIHMPFESVKSVVLMYCMLLVKECTIYRLHA